MATRLRLTGDHCRGVRNEYLHAESMVDQGDRFRQMECDTLWGNSRDVSR